MTKVLVHALVVFAALFVVLALPALLQTDVSSLFSDSAKVVDAVASASMEIPDKPSGEFVVLLNKSLHEDTASQWEVFFSGGDAGVIMSDVECRVFDSDSPGLQMAQRYMARLPENQMKLKAENGVLLASKAENSMFDVIVMSWEIFEAYKINVEKISDDVLVIEVKGEEDEKV